MAIFHPEQPGGDEPSSELKVRRALRVLDDEWHVFHRVRWQSVRAGRQGDGEADFILVHRRHGIVVVEVKGGRVEANDGHWTTTDRFDIKSTIKNPYEQVVASKHALLAFLRPLLQVRVPPICHLVIFPDGVVDGSVGLHPPEVTWEQPHLDDLAVSVSALLRHWAQEFCWYMTDAELEAVVSRLAPTLRIKSSLRTHVSSSEAQLVELTQRQVLLLSNLRRVRRCIVTGGAGTGKTFLALEKARLLARDGAKVLLTCFNAPLAKHLQSVAPPGVSISTFHSLLLQLRRQLQAGARRSSDDFAEIFQLLLGASSAFPRYDAVLVDEAQDFDTRWLSFVETRLLEDGGFYYLFADPHQELYARGFVEPRDCVPFELTQNCRNTLPIATLVARSLGDELPEAGPEGAPVSFIEASGDELSVVQSVVDDLVVRERVRESDVVVLCRTRGQVDALLRRTTSTAAFVDAAEKQGILVDTIHRFKGLEATVVVLAYDAADDRANDSTLLYVGTSRARSFLVVIGHRSTIRKLQA